MAHRFPVSVKGVVLKDDRVLLLKNERNEWELPGGKLELGESPPACVRRELKEELSLDIVPVRLIDSWLYSIFENVHVLILAYGCLSPGSTAFKVSDEHQGGAWIGLDQLDDLNLPAGYKQSIRLWREECGRRT
ncbi:MAG TPA: NUDIX hydrolase [Selenomonadales bacterium]|nr:NUDIX hydrolase [Selenomonadales bacterium]